MRQYLFDTTLLHYFFPQWVTEIESEVNFYSDALPNSTSKLLYVDTALKAVKKTISELKSLKLRGKRNKDKTALLVKGSSIFLLSTYSSEAAKEN